MVHSWICQSLNLHQMISNTDEDSSLRCLDFFFKKFYDFLSNKYYWMSLVGSNGMASLEIPEIYQLSIQELYFQQTFKFLEWHHCRKASLINSIKRNFESFLSSLLPPKCLDHSIEIKIIFSSRWPNLKSYQIAVINGYHFRLSYSSIPRIVSLIHCCCFCWWWAMKASLQFKIQY